MSHDSVKKQLYFTVNDCVAPQDMAFVEEVNNNSVDGSADLLCEKIKKLHEASDFGLFAQSCAIGKLIVALTEKLQSKSPVKLKEQLSLFHINYGVTKIKELMRIHRLCQRFPKLLCVRTGFNVETLRKSLTLIESVCETDQDFWRTLAP